MTGLEQFLHTVKAIDSDRAPHWQVGLGDWTFERGEIVGVFADAVVLRQVNKRSSANTRHEAVQITEDVVHTLVPFSSIRLDRVLERPATNTAQAPSRRRPPLFAAIRSRASRPARSAE